MKTSPDSIAAISVALVEDDLRIRESVARVVRRAPALRLVGPFCDGESAVEKLPALLPDVVLMDIELPGMSGIECTRRLREALPQAQILIFTVFSDSDKVMRALEAGANGYLLKRSSPRELIDAIQAILKGGAPMSGEIARKFVEAFRAGSSRSPGHGATLTARETEVLELLAKGYLLKEISANLGISYDTVRFHLKHVYEKLHVRSRSEALLKYLR